MIKKIIRKILNIPSTSMSFRESMDLLELPVVTFYQGDTKINLLLDTGSNDCIIDSNFLKNIEYKNLNIEANLYGMEGKENKVGVCIINLTYKDNNYEHSFLIQDMEAPFSAIKKECGVTINGILGSKFFNKFKYVLDFNELIAYSKL